MKEDKIEMSRAVLVEVDFKNDKREDWKRNLAELSRLMETAGGETVAVLTQAKAAPDVRTLIGSGKVGELAYLCKHNNADLVVFDEDLSPSQIRNLEDSIDGARVIDRSMLILDIFALHATTSEGRLQVELAQLKYTAPRLIGRGNELSRLGGGIGTRGPGESKLESDRRHLKRKITALEEELKEIDKSRMTMRAARDKSKLMKIAIVGYTNAGKSTLLNSLTDAGILAEDKLFATLDPTTRKYELPCGESVLLTDTVGFIRNLPHHLVKAFKSTLDEAVYADALLIIIDSSDPDCESQLHVTEDTLAELGAKDKPTLYVFNKCDIETNQTLTMRKVGDFEDIVYISAKTGQGIDLLISKLEKIVNDGKKTITFLIPLAKQALVSKLYSDAAVIECVYLDDVVRVIATVDAKTESLLKEFIVE